MKLSWFRLTLLGVLVVAVIDVYVHGFGRMIGELMGVFVMVQW